MSNEIIKILDDLGRRFGVAIDWSDKNSMPYLEKLNERFIQWEITTSIVCGVTGILLFVIGLVGVIYSIKKINASDCYDAGYYAVILGMTATVFIMGCAVILTQCFDICRAVYLPEIAIYNYIDGLISQ